MRYSDIIQKRTAALPSDIMNYWLTEVTHAMLPV